MQPGAADFRGLSRQAVDALKSMPEYHRFLRGMISWMGYRSVILPYHETSRVAGKIKILIWQNVPSGHGRDLFLLSYTALYRHDAGGVFCSVSQPLQIIYVLSFWLTGRSSELGGRLEFTDVCDARDRRYGDDLAWVSLVFMLVIYSRK